MTEQEERNLAYFLTPEGLNVITAAIVRESLNRHSDEAFQEGFGLAKAQARRILRAWEMCRLPEWDGEMLQTIIPERLFPNRDVLAAHVRQALPAMFAPLEGIGWAELNRYITCSSVERQWAEWYAQAGGKMPVEASGAAPATEAQPEGETTTSSDDWKAKARRIADELFDHDTECRTRDSLKGYSERVMTEMQKREIHGPRGRIDNPGTIMRDALQGSKWWASKRK